MMFYFPIREYEVLSLFLQFFLMRKLNILKLH